MENSLHSEFKEMIKSAKIISPTSYIFMDKTYSKEIQRGNDQADDSSNNYVVTHLKYHLYKVFHCRQYTYADSELQSISNYSNIQDFTIELSKANSGSGFWEPGWKILRINEKERVIEAIKDGLKLWVIPEHFYFPNGKPEVEKIGYIKMVKEFRELNPGFYTALGNKPLEQIDKMTLVRLYWNIQTSYAALLTKCITSELNALDIPFRFKVLKNPDHYPRSDSAVLYIHKPYLKTAQKAFTNIYQTVKPFLNSHTSFIAKRLAPGLALAEDPGNKESFGINRCRTLAESLYQIYKNGLNDISTDRIISEIDKYFKNLSLNLSFPYLNPFSLDDYDILFEGVFN